MSCRVSICLKEGVKSNYVCCLSVMLGKYMYLFGIESKVLMVSCQVGIRLVKKKRFHSVMSDRYTVWY